MRSMNLLAAQLPELSLEAQMPQNLPLNTAQAMQAGVAWGSIGAVRQIISEVKKQPGMQNCRCLIAGGDRHFFYENIEGLEITPELFTLIGVTLAKKG